MLETVARIRWIGMVLGLANATISALAYLFLTVRAERIKRGLQT